MGHLKHILHFFIICFWIYYWFNKYSFQLTFHNSSLCWFVSVKKYISWLNIYILYMQHISVKIQTRHAENILLLLKYSLLGCEQYKMYWLLFRLLSGHLLWGSRKYLSFKWNSKPSNHWNRKCSSVCYCLFRCQTHFIYYGKKCVTLWIIF